MGPAIHRTALSALALALCAAMVASAQLAVRPEEVVKLKLDPARVELKKGGTADLSLQAAILRGYHVNSSKPLEDYLIPSRVELQSDEFELEEAKFPEGELKAFDFSEEKMSVYEGTLRVPLRLRARKGTAAGAYTAEVTFYYQACNDRLCLRPAKRTATLTLKLQ